MNIDEAFISLPSVVKKNNGEHIEVVLKVLPRTIGHYYEAIHVHENGDETKVTYINLIGLNELLGIPISVEEFEKRLIPYLHLMNREGQLEYEIKQMPIRFLDKKKTELYGEDVYVDVLCNFNFAFMNYYHPVKRQYENTEVDVISFCVGGNYFYTLLSLTEFEEIVNHKSK